ncbi:DUF1272 domain-containing protein [Kineosporia sp. J2-2]|uniref:DUF1272 domain-containing protein n=1 Tax=Kineosporia corallincola TaxID=2835133 RepID=A0ABS5TNR2_9ACTN|nr:DUF1272 domain-containing protein [Kineosporia corallincola]MBT0772747.1 DUF1272 domain-containing protein [Kineosporia corallincola]
MLELRPNCESCDQDLATDSPDVWICSFECTWCTDCAASFADNACPNDKGNLVSRPIRTAEKLTEFPASTTRVHNPELQVAKVG